MLDKTQLRATEGIPQQQLGNVSTFKKIIKPACLCDCDNRVHASAEKVNISIPNRGMVRPLLLYTDAA